MSWHFWQFRIWEAQAPTSGWFDSSSFGTRNQVIARLNPTVTCKEPARRFWSGGTFLVRRAILGAARVYGRTLSKRSSQLIVIFPLFKALVVHLYWHLYTATAGLGQDLWASKFGLSWLQSLFSFLLYFWERNLEHHRYLASVFGISISHSSASYPLCGALRVLGCRNLVVGLLKECIDVRVDVSKVEVAGVAVVPLSGLLVGDARG